VKQMARAAGSGVSTEQAAAVSQTALAISRRSSRKPEGPSTSITAAAGRMSARFQRTWRSPSTLQWTNKDQIGPNLDIRRMVTVEWSGSDPAGYLVVAGTATQAGPAPLRGICCGPIAWR
jgi:hypothetical protein